MIKIEKNKEEIVEIIRFITEKCEFETEYDGRMETYCFYCNKHNPTDETHNEGCIYIKAKKVLAGLKKENENMFLVAVEETYSVMKKRWYCIPCDRYFYVEAGYHSHKKSKTHKWKVEMYKTNRELWWSLKGRYRK